MAQTQAGTNRSFKANSDFSAKQYYIAKYDTTENQVVLAAAATDKIAGVVTGWLVNGTVGDVVVVESGAFSTLVHMATSCSIGDLITSDSSGKGVVTTTNKDFIVGRALQAAGADGDVIEVQLLMCYLSS